MAAAADALSFVVAVGSAAADLGEWLLPAAATAGAVTALLVRGHRQRRQRGRRE
jgi:hypothetical protein